MSHTVVSGITWHLSVWWTPGTCSVVFCSLTGLLWWFYGILESRKTIPEYCNCLHGQTQAAVISQLQREVFSGKERTEERKPQSPFFDGEMTLVTSFVSKNFNLMSTWKTFWEPWPSSVILKLSVNLTYFQCVRLVTCKLYNCEVVLACSTILCSPQFLYLFHHPAVREFVGWHWFDLWLTHETVLSGNRNFETVMLWIMLNLSKLEGIGKALLLGGLLHFLI